MHVCDIYYKVLFIVKRYIFVYAYDMNSIPTDGVAYSLGKVNGDMWYVRMYIHAYWFNVICLQYIYICMYSSVSVKILSYVHCRERGVYVWGDVCEIIRISNLETGIYPYCNHKQTIYQCVVSLIIAKLYTYLPCSKWCACNMQLPCMFNETRMQHSW